MTLWFMKRKWRFKGIKRLAFLPKVIKLLQKNQYFNYGFSKPERSPLPTTAPSSVEVVIQLRPQMPLPFLFMKVGNEMAGGVWPGRAGQIQLAGRCWKTPSGQSSLFQMALNFRPCARDGKLPLPSLFGKHMHILGAMLLRSGGGAASGKIPS